MRLILAFQAFFAVLFGKALPPALQLPGPAPGSRPSSTAPQATPSTTASSGDLDRARSDLAQATSRMGDLERALADAKQDRDALLRERDGLKVAHAEAVKSEAKLAEARAAREQAEARLGKAREDGALSLLAWLQREGRLIDFCMEPIDGFSDAQVGAAVRAIHKGCRKVLGQGLALEPVLPGEEGAKVEVPPGFDPAAIQLSGRVRGDPPFRGALVHHGWRTTKVVVPVAGAVDATVLAPAEVEL